MTSIKLTVTGAHAWASVEGPLTSGMVGIPVTIEYDEAWDGLTKNLMCRCSPWGSNSGENRAILNVGETAVVAHEVMQADMYLYLGVEGFSDDGKLVMPTTWARCGKIEYGANTCDDPSTDPELSVWNQLQVEMEKTKEYVLTPEQAVNIQTYAREAKQAAEEAKQAVESGLYYLPTVSQPTANTLMFEFRPSITGAPIPKPVTVVLPSGSSSGDALTLTSPDGSLWGLAVTDDGTVYGVKQDDGADGDAGAVEPSAVPFSAFNFIQVSDTHYQYSQEATAVVVDNVNAQTDVDLVTNSGDITLDQTQDDTVKAAELTEYKTNLRDQLNIPMYPCAGGHDLCESMDTIWPEYTGVERLQEIEHKGCVLLLADNLKSGWLDWLEERVAANAGKRIFVFEHWPIENDEFTVGLKEGESRATWDDDEMRRILRLLRNNHNIIWFTGHTHWAFGVAERDVYNADGLMGTIVHTPYLNAYQGWKVEVGEASTVLRGVSFAEGGMSYLGEGYDYTIVQDITDYGEAEIVTEGETVTVGGSTDISVYLTAAPRSDQTVYLTAGDGISIGVTELVFTPSNYATPQIVTVTGVTAGTGTLTLYSQSRTTKRKIDVVEGVATINWFNKAKPLTSLGSVYGTAITANYQLSNLIPAKTGDRVRTTDLGSTTTKRLRMFDADFNCIAEAGSSAATVDYTITEEGVAYIAVLFRGATVGQADTIMVTVNQELPSEYIAYNGEPVGYTITNYADMAAPTVSGGYYNGSLVQTDDANTNVSNLIPVTVGATVNGNNIYKTDAAQYAYLYDAAKNILERVAYNGAVQITNESAAYVAVCYAATATDLMVMVDQMVPGYYVEGSDTM